MLNYNKYRHTNKRKSITPIKSAKRIISKLSRFISSHLLITSIVLVIFISSAYVTGLVYNHYKIDINKSNINNVNPKSVILDTYGKQIEITTTTPILPRKENLVSRGGIIRPKVNKSIVEPVVSDKVDMVIEDKKVDIIEKKDNKVSFDYIDSFQGNISMYTLAYNECNKLPSSPFYGITASGVRVKSNHTVATGRNIPFGSKLRIQGLDTVYIAEDVGQAIKWNCIDIYTDNLSQANQWGRQSRMVYILSKGNGKVK